MASNGTQSGFGDAPAFPEEDALQIGGDLEEVARYARFRGNAIRGTNAERDAYTDVTNGLLWSNTTTGALERYNGTSWQVVWERTGWSTQTAANDWTANTGSNAPQVSRDGVIVTWRGGMFGGTSSSNATTVPTWARPTRDVRGQVTLSDNTTIGRFRVATNGQVFFSGSISTDAQFSWSVL